MAESGKYSGCVLGASDEENDIFCEPCREVGQQAIAEGYCVDCPEYLCEKCYQSHYKHNAFKHHMLLDAKAMPKDSASRKTLVDVCVEKCSVHPTKVTEFFCETCDTLGCHVCVTLDHRQCAELKHIPEIAKNFEKLNKYSDFTQYLLKTEDNFSKHSKTIAANGTILNSEMIKRVKQDLKRQRAKINTFFDQLEKVTNDQIATIGKKNRDSLQVASNKLNSMYEEFRRIRNRIEETKNGQTCELFIAVKRGARKMKEFDEQFDQLLNEERIEQCTSIPSTQIQTMMRTTTELCRIADRLESKINIITESGYYRKPSVSGITVVRGYFCVVAYDKTGYLKVIDTRIMCIISEIDLDAYELCALTSVTDNQVFSSQRGRDWDWIAVLNQF